MKARSLLLLAIPFLLLGCDSNEESEPGYIASMKFGDKVTLTTANYKDYLKINFGSEVLKNDAGVFYKIKYWLSAEGYSSLTYYFDPVTFVIQYTYLDSSGTSKTTTENFNREVGTNGKIAYSATEIACNYGGVSSIHIHSLTFGEKHYVVKNK